MNASSLRASVYLWSAQLLLGGWVTACGTADESRAPSGDGGAAGSPSMSPEECRALERDAVAPIAHDPCVADSDCTELRRQTDCLLICGSPMTKRQAEEVTRWLDAFEAERCTGNCTEERVCALTDHGPIYCRTDGYCDYED